jgi:hypothetical protein
VKNGGLDKPKKKPEQVEERLCPYSSPIFEPVSSKMSFPPKMLTRPSRRKSYRRLLDVESTTPVNYDHITLNL